jgi:hypothetical protein
MQSGWRAIQPREKLRDTNLGALKHTHRLDLSPHAAGVETIPAEHTAIEQTEEATRPSSSIAASERCGLARNLRKSALETPNSAPASETLIECRLSPNMIVVVFIAGVISPKARKRDAETPGNSSYFRSRTMEADSAKGPPQLTEVVGLGQHTWRRRSVDGCVRGQCLRG